jgi:hypothetical protein
MFVLGFDDLFVSWGEGDPKMNILPLILMFSWARVDCFGWADSALVDQLEPECLTSTPVGLQMC